MAALLVVWVKTKDYLEQRWVKTKDYLEQHFVKFLVYGMYFSHLMISKNYAYTQ